MHINNSLVQQLLNNPLLILGSLWLLDLELLEHRDDLVLAEPHACETVDGLTVKTKLSDLILISTGGSSSISGSPFGSGTLESSLVCEENLGNLGVLGVVGLS